MVARHSPLTALPTASAAAGCTPAPAAVATAERVEETVQSMLALMLKESPVDPVLVAVVQKALAAVQEALAAQRKVRAVMQSLIEALAAA